MRADPQVTAESAPAASASPEPVARSRRNWLRGAIIGILIVALIAAVAIWSQTSGAAGGAATVQTNADAPSDRVDVTATVVRVDPTAGELLLRLQVIPRGGLTTEGGLSPAEDLEILTSRAMKSDPFFPALERIGTVDVPVALGGSGITAYPFDRYTATLEFTARQGGETVPVNVTFTNRDALFAAASDAYTEADADVIELGLSRSSGVLTFALFMIAAMWALAIAVATAAWFLFSRKRGLVWPALGWMAASLFAIAAFRNAAPGAPPIGSLIDYLAFFWAEGIIAVCVFLTAMGGVRQEVAAESAPHA